MRQVGEEGVCDVEDDESDRRSPAHSKLASEAVAHEAQRLHRLLHLGERLRAHLIRVVQHIGDGSHRDAGGLRDVADAYVGSHVMAARSMMGIWCSLPAKRRGMLSVA